MIKVPENKQSGFTLIEIILTLVIAAVVGAGLVQYLGSSLTKSSVPIQRLRQAYDLQQVMENITADYRENVRDKFDLATLKGDIGDKTPPTNPKNNDYGKYIVVENKFVKFTPQIGDVPDTDPDKKKKLLMVTIKKGSGEILTTLFSTP